MVNVFAKLTELKYACFSADAEVARHGEAEYTRSLIDSLKGRRREYVEDRMRHGHLVLSSITAEEREKFLDHILVTTSEDNFKQFISSQFCHECIAANFEFVEWMLNYVEQKKLTLWVWLRHTPTDLPQLLDLFAQKRHLYYLYPDVNVLNHGRPFSPQGFLALLKLCEKEELQSNIIRSGQKPIDEWKNYGALSMLIIHNQIDESILSSEVQSLIIARELAYELHVNRDPEFLAELYSLFSDSELMQIFSRAYRFPQGREELGNAMAYITKVREMTVSDRQVEKS